MTAFPRPETARRAATAIAGARAAFGVLALAAPSRLLNPWIGDRTGDPGALLLARAVGARDLAVGLGGLLSQRHDQPVRGWLEAGALCDAADAGATLLAFSKLPRVGRWVVLSMAAGSAVLAGAAAQSVDKP